MRFDDEHVRIFEYLAIAVVFFSRYGNNNAKNAQLRLNAIWGIKIVLRICIIKYTKRQIYICVCVHSYSDLSISLACTVFTLLFFYIEADKGELKCTLPWRNHNILWFKSEGDVSAKYSVCINIVLLYIILYFDMRVYAVQYSMTIYIVQCIHISLYCRIYDIWAVNRTRRWKAYKMSSRNKAKGNWWEKR